MAEGSGTRKAFDRYLSPIDIWAMAFGCMVGWGAFVMPGTTFLPTAGPAGTVIAIVLGVVLMLLISANYCFMMEHNPGTGGVYTRGTPSAGITHFSASGFCVSPI